MSANKRNCAISIEAERYLETLVRPAENLEFSLAQFGRPVAFAFQGVVATGGVFCIPIVD